MQTLVRPLTPIDLNDLPDDGQRYELIGGELIVSPAPVIEHQRILGRLYLLFAMFVARHGLGEVLFAPVDVRLTEHDQVQPDLIFVARDRLGIIHPARIEGAPDLVLEILSPRTRHVDLVRKAALYATAGVREYWIVDPEARTVTVSALAGGHFESGPASDPIARSVVLPGLEIDPAELFADLA